MINGLQQAKCINDEMTDNITKLPESGVLCDDITEFGVAEDHLSPQGEGDLRPCQTK